MKIKFFTALSLSALETAVNTFLADLTGTLIDVDLSRVENSYVALVSYSETAAAADTTDETT